MPEAKTSRMLTTPLSSRPSTTGRWRNPLVSITSAASPTVISEVAVLGFLVIHCETGDLVRSGTGGGRAQHIPLGQDAGQPGTLHDDGRAHPGLHHHAGDLRDRTLGRGGEDLGGHDVPKLDHPRPPTSYRTSPPSR